MKLSLEQVRADFERHTREHQITIALDNGVYRHVICSKPGTSIYRFEIVTYPGHLVVSGDMGSWTFCRIRDMFEFFRYPEGHINRPYWAEKLVAVDRVGNEVGHPGKEFCEDTFQQNVLEQLQNMEAPAHVVERVRDEVFPYCADGAHAAMQALRDFDEDGYSFPDFFELPYTNWTFHYTWICLAIVWAINRYDSARGSVAEGREQVTA